jgi:hypothetical protein
MADADDDRLDAALAALTDPGEDAGFRTRVLSRLDAPGDGAQPSLPGRWAAAGVLLAAALVVATFYPWRPHRPVGRDVERAAEEALAASPAGDSIVTAAPAAGPGNGTSAPSATEQPAPQVASAHRRTSGAVREARMVAARESLADDQPLPYGMERIRVDPVAIPSFTLREVREDPMMAALTPPEPVRVDPIDIAEIAPRR